MGASVHVGVSNWKTDNGEKARMHVTNTYANAMHMMTWYELQMMTWQSATCKQMTRQLWRITGGHLAPRIRGVTHQHLVLVIYISEVPSWSPSSPARHLDLHRSIVVVSPTLLLRLSLPLSDKVKQLHGDCISYNKVTTIWLLPVADNSVTKHDHLIQ